MIGSHASMLGAIFDQMTLSQSAFLRIMVPSLSYLAHGLPVGLFYAAIIPWASAGGASAADLAHLLALMSFPFGFKIVGAIIMDRYRLRAMGRRRPWMILSNLLIVGGLGMAALLSPTPRDIGILTWLAFAVSLGCSTLDTAIDGLAVDVLKENERGSASSWMYGAQAVGLAVGAMGGATLLDAWGSRPTFLIFAGFSIPFLLVALCIRENTMDTFWPLNGKRTENHQRDQASPNWPSLVKALFKGLLNKQSVTLLAVSLVGGTLTGALNAYWPLMATKEASLGSAAVGQIMGIAMLTGAVLSVLVGHALVRAVGPNWAAVVAFALLGTLAACLSHANLGHASLLLFLGLTIVWVLGDLLISIGLNPLRLRLSLREVGATHFTAYASASNLAKPLGVLLVGGGYDAGYRDELLLGAAILAAVAGVLTLQVGSSETPARLTT